MLSLLVPAEPFAASVVLSDAPTWDLDRSYPTQQAWDDAADVVRARLDAFPKNGSVRIRNARELAAILKDVRYLRTHAGHLARFALLKHLLDEDDAALDARLRLASGLETRVEAAVAWVPAEIRHVGIDTVRKWQRALPPPAQENWYINQIATAGRHFVQPGSEAAVALLGSVPGQIVASFETLTRSNLLNSRMPSAQGSSADVDLSDMQRAMFDSSAARRAEARSVYFAQLNRLAPYLSLLATQRLATQQRMAELNGFRDALDWNFHAGDRLPDGAVDAMVRSARESSALLAEYAAQVRRFSAAGELHVGDLNTRIKAAAPRKLDLQAAKAEIVDAWQPLGTAAQKRVETLLEKPWFDWQPRTNKHDAGVWWGLGLDHPYALLSFSGDVASERTLAQIAPLVMLYAAVPPGRAGQTRADDYPVYGNAVWFLGQMLLDDHRLALSEDPAERRAIRLDNCRRLWNTHFHNVMLVEFEQAIYRGLSSDAPQTQAELSRTFHAIAAGYLGRAEPPVVVDDEYALHLLATLDSREGEVFASWAFAMAAAARMSERIADGDVDTIQAIVAPFAADDVYTSSDLLLRAGVDLNGPAPYAALRRRFQKLLDGLQNEE